MKTYNCPDCEYTFTCDACPRVKAKNNKLNQVLHIPKYFPDSFIWYADQEILDCCNICDNHIKNGGSGVCNCILPQIIKAESIC